MRRVWSRIVGALVLAVALGGASPVALAKQTFVYVHDRQTGGGIWGFRMDKQGNLTSLAGSPFALVDEPVATCGGHCQSMAYSSKRKTLYAGGDTGVSAWTVNKDGSLTLVPGSPFAPGAATAFSGTGVVQSGKRVFVYSTSYFAGGVFAWEADRDGVLTELAGSPFTTGAGPSGLAVVKKLVFVANQDAGSVSSYLAGKDGTLTSAPGSPVMPAPVGFIYNVSPDPRGRALYVADDLGAVHAFAVDKKTAGLTPIAGSPFATASMEPKTGAIVTKTFLYAVDFDVTDNALQPFRIAKDGALASTGIVINTPLGPLTHATDPKGKRIVIAGSDGVVVATIDDKTDGGLGGLGSQAISSANPNAVVIVNR